MHFKLTPWKYMGACRSMGYNWALCGGLSIISPTMISTKPLGFQTQTLNFTPLAMYLFKQKSSYLSEVGETIAKSPCEDYSPGRDTVAVVPATMV